MGRDHFKKSRPKRYWIKRTAAVLLMGGAFIWWMISNWLNGDNGITEGPPLSLGENLPQLMLVKNDALFLSPNGALYRWGERTVQADVPQRIQIDLKVQKVAANEDATIAILTDGTIWGWGKRPSIIPPNPDYAPDVARQLFSDTGFIDVCMGNQHVLVLKQAGTIWTWGRNDHWQLGQGRQSKDDKPILKESLTLLQIGNESDWDSIYSSDRVSYGIKTDGSIFRWGKQSMTFWDSTGLNPTFRSTFPQDDSPDFTRPARFTEKKRWKQVVALADIAILLHHDGSLWIDGTPPSFFDWLPFDQQNPHRLEPLGHETDWFRILASEAFLLGQKRDGSWWGIGHNQVNQMALDESVDISFAKKWVKLPDSFDPWAMVIGVQTTLVLTRDGRLWSAGFHIGNSSHFKTKWNQCAFWMSQKIPFIKLPRLKPSSHQGFRHIWTWHPE